MSSHNCFSVAALFPWDYIALPIGCGRRLLAGDSLLDVLTSESGRVFINKTLVVCTHFIRRVVLGLQFL